MRKVTRRNVLEGLIPLAAIASPHFLLAEQQKVPPTDNCFSPITFGAKANGKDLDTRAINAAIDACAQRGGGTVYLTPGTYKCGTVVLKSRVTLYLEAGATLLGSENIADYTAMPGLVAANDTGWRHLIYARGAESIGLAGPGTINGQGPTFLKPSGIPAYPPEDAWADVIARSLAAKGERPSPMIEFVDCKWVRVVDVRIEDAPSWTMRPINCDQVFIQGVSIRNAVTGHNTDGIDVTGCKNVFISGCTIETGDDCICLKSENPYGSEPRLTKNIVISDCVMTTCSNGIKLGTATQGGFENITITNCVIYNDDVDYKYRVVSGIALEIVDGGWIDGITITNIRMQRTRTPLFIRLGNRSHPFATPEHRLTNVSISNVQATDSVLASSITGLPGQAIRNITLTDINVENSFPCRPEWVGRTVPERPDAYPEARMYGMLPCSGLYVRHAHDLELKGITFRATAGEARPAVILDNVHNAVIRDLQTTTITGPQPVLELRGSSEVWVTGCSLPPSTATLVGVSGITSADMTITNNRIGRAKAPVVLASEVRPDQVTVAANA